MADYLLCSILIKEGRPQLFSGSQDVSDFDATIPRIGSSATAYGAAVIRHLEALNIFTVVGSQALVSARDKLTCMQLLAAHGLPVPSTGMSKSDHFSSMIYDRISSGRAVIKLLESTQGLGVILSETPKQGQTIIEGFHRVEKDVLIQEYIEDANGSDVRVFVVDGEIVGAMIRQAQKGEFRSNLHRGAKSIITELTEEESSIALRACDILGLAVAGVDILRSASGPLILEVNASPGLEGIETTTKMDIAGKVIQYLERSVS